jgi:hypothetical protein
MTARSRNVSRRVSLTAQIIAAKLEAAECESLTEARLTMLRRLRIGAQRRRLLTATGNRTYNSSVEITTQKRLVTMLLRNLKSTKSRSEWGHLSANPPAYQNNMRE